MMKKGDLVPNLVPKTEKPANVHGSYLHEEVQKQQRNVNGRFRNKELQLQMYP
jgi:hypothetical protein